MLTWYILPVERLDLLETLSLSMNLSSATHVGDIHMALQSPMSLKEEKAQLQKKLHKATEDVLAYVCVDLNQVPLGKFSKADMEKQLMHWVHSN